MANEKAKEPVKKVLNQIVNVGRVSDHMHPDDRYKLTNNPVADGDLIVGLELEIENFVNRPTEYFGFMYHEDNSLRNNGVEWVTTPTKLKFLEPLLQSFFDTAKVSDNNYSERCSVHVHVNCQDMTLEQISNVVLLYQVFERMLFDFVGNDRDKNIFCVPWSQANTCINIYNVISNWDYRQLRNWQKYTALNLLPLMQKGTVEYRHLHGTHDVSKIMTWVNLLCCIHSYAKRANAEELRNTIMELNTSSAYEQLLNGVFAQWVVHLTQHQNHRVSMEAGVLDAKICLSDGSPVRPVERVDVPDFFTNIAREGGVNRAFIRTQTGPVQPNQEVAPRRQFANVPEWRTIRTEATMTAEEFTRLQREAIDNMNLYARLPDPQS